MVVREGLEEEDRGDKSLRRPKITSLLRTKLGELSPSVDPIGRDIRIPVFDPVNVLNRTNKGERVLVT